MVRKSQPLFLKLVLVGAVLLFVAVILSGLDATDGMCKLSVWVGHLGFFMLFYPLLVKLWRVAVLFNNPKLKRMALTNADMLKRVFVIVMVTVVFLIVWSIVDPVQAITKDEGARSKTSTVVSRSTTCSSDDGHFGTIIIALEFLLLLWGVSLCVQSRAVSAEFAETKHIAFGIYNTTITAMICLILLFGFDTNPNSEAAITGIGVFFSVMTVLIALYVPKIFAVSRGVQLGNPQFQNQGTAVTAPGSDGPAYSNQVGPIDA